MTPRLGAPRGLFAGVVSAGFLGALLEYLLSGLTFGLKQGWDALPTSRFQPNLFTFSIDPNSLNFLGDVRPDGIGFWQVAEGTRQGHVPQGVFS